MVTKFKAEQPISEKDFLERELNDGIRGHQMGWLKWGFLLAFYFLRRYSTSGMPPQKFFAHSLRLTIQQGGDTDTNACIVGGLMGALVGLNNIPKEWTKKVYECDTGHGN
mmetsp:Transcript_13041/g.20240  ORF Transcript_13041/g.20240 Transcript_13041/m.20240 type:complete len:110 (+) Transcript_13041:760-1089(+)